jgi:dihydropyrimidinase
VATDHCAFTTEQKRFGLGDFTKIPNGTGGLEDRMPMLWTHGVTPAASRPTSSWPSRAPTSPRSWAATPQGRVMVGADADLVVWDPRKEKTITAGAQQSPSTTTSSRGTT